MPPTPIPNETEVRAKRSDPMLRVRDLKTYFELDEGTVKAVDGVSFEMQAGSTLAIVGESGCGKSVTALSILQIVDRPGRIVGGEVWWRHQERDGDGRAIELTSLRANGEQMRRIRGAEIAMIFQEPMVSFSPVHTIGAQIMEAIRLHRDVSRKEARRLAVDICGRVGIPQPEQRVDYYPHLLSGGLRQRAMIAMALSCSPRLLIADEPTTAIDVTTQAQILHLLKELQQQNHMAILFITHDLGVVAEMADTVVVMYLGRVVETGPVDEIFHAPRHPYTEALLRSIPHIRGRRGGKLASITGAIPHPFNRPRGCPFHNRCERAVAGRCDASEPPSLRTVAEDHDVSCFLYSG